MRQKNVTPYELHSSGHSSAEGDFPPVTIAPGEVVDYPISITGCEPVEDEPVKTKAKTVTVTPEEGATP